MGDGFMGGLAPHFFVFDFFTNFHFDFSKDLLEVLRFFPLLNHGGKIFEKKIFRLAVTSPQQWGSKPPINLITMVKMSSYISLCPIFMKLGTFVHFIGNKNLGKIWVDTDIFVGVMTSSKKKCGGGPPINLITSEICQFVF